MTFYHSGFHLTLYSIFLILLERFLDINGKQPCVMKRALNYELEDWLS
jgi:hypothetical protein